MTRPAALLALLALAALSDRAEAHAHLKSAAPPAGGVARTSPAELDLAFSEALNLRFSGLAVTGPDSHPVVVGAPALKPGDDTALVVQVPAPLKPGLYTVAWHALSTDGHKTTGRYTFTVAP